MIVDAAFMDETERGLYASLNEVQLKRINEPGPGLFIAETPNVILRAMNAGYRVRSLLIDEKFVRSEESLENSGIRASASEVLKRAGSAPVYTASLQELSKISGFRQTRGILAAMERKELPALADVIRNARRIAVLENVENPTNVGAVFRSAAGLGFDAVILTCRSADPLYRRAARVSMGTVFQIPWTFTGDKHTAWQDAGLPVIRAEGFKLASMALSEHSVSLSDPRLKEEKKLAVLIGNEEEGLTERTIDASDYIVRIPMMNGVDSLNAAAAAAVTFWELR